MRSRRTETLARGIAVDGYALPASAQVTRDVFTIGAGQRLDLELRAGSDDRYASGPGVWLMHDHTDQNTTNNGINPGGDITTIVYEGFMGKEGLPRAATSLGRFFDPAYYRGQVPVFDPAIFHTTRERYAEGWDAEQPGGRPTPSGRRAETPGTTTTSEEQQELGEHRVVATSCPTPRGFQRVVMREGSQEAREGEVYGFEPRVIHAERCEEIELVLENRDSVRHSLMIPGLDPMFAQEFAGPGTRTARFVTPDEDVTLPFHCHVSMHEKMGMHGELSVGRGGAPAAELPAPGQHLYDGTSTVISVDPRKGRVVLDHKEIPGFMAAMAGMSFLVTPSSLLEGLHPSEAVRFMIDADQRVVVNIVPVPALPALAQQR